MSRSKCILFRKCYPKTQQLAVFYACGTDMRTNSNVLTQSTFYIQRGKYNMIWKQEENCYIRANTANNVILTCVTFDFSLQHVNL